MSIHDLVFKTTSTEVIYDPLTLVVSTAKNVIITNNGTEDLSDLGLYLVPAQDLGDLDHAAVLPPESDLQDLLEWGEAVYLGVETVGGLKVAAPQNDTSTLTTYFRRSKGASESNKIPLVDIAANESKTVVLTLETPPSVISRRLFVSLAVS